MFMMATRTATLVDAIAARSDAGASFATRAAAVVFMAVLTAAAAQISIPLPFTQVPFTFQPTVVLLGGLVLGGRLGALSQGLYLAAGIAGLPVFAASATLPPGAWRLLGPTGGYLMSYPLAAFVAGVLAQRGFDRRYVTSVLAMALGLLVIYTSGTLWLASVTGHGGAASSLVTAIATGVAPFVVADLVKLAGAAGIVPGLWRLLGTPPREPRT
jgi:biotin transport system substrate-specific component